VSLILCVLIIFSLLLTPNKNNCRADRVRAAWTKRLITAVPVDGSRLNPSAARAFVPRIEAAAVNMIRFTDVNLAVHAGIYKHLIATAVAKI
jgi:hypothetical protein